MFVTQTLKDLKSQNWILLSIQTDRVTDVEERIVKEVISRGGLESELAEREAT